MYNQEIINGLKGKLIVSCQALENEPLHSPFIMSRMALSAKMGGASGIRANSVEDIEEIKKTVDLPVIGIIKKNYNSSQVYITPTIKEVRELIKTNAEIIAIDATKRERPNKEKIEDLILLIKKSGKIAMADISTLEEGIYAENLGFDIISTTLSGYTEYSIKRTQPSFELISELKKSIDKPIIAEGHIRTPEQLKKVLKCGAFCAVIGSSITRPQLITKQFTDVL